MVTTNRKRLAVLLSGRGSNMEAILESSKTADYPASIVLVISDNPKAAGLNTAKKAGIEAVAFPRADFQNKNRFEEAIAEKIENARIDLICLAGFMRLLSSGFTDRFAGKLINIHPSLLPKHKGLDTHKRALEAGDTVHGCTIHYVNAEMDGGEIIAQAEVPILKNDTPDTLAARVLIEEHRLYPKVIKELCSTD